MRRRSRLGGGARGEGIRRGAQRPRLVQRFRAHRLGRGRPGQRGGQERDGHDAAVAAVPSRPSRITVEHPQHLLELGRELRGVARRARTVARRAQPVPQPHHVIGDRALDARGAQRAAEPVAIARLGVRDVAREQRVKLMLRPADPGERCRRGRGHADRLSRPAPHPQPGEERRADQQHEPAPRDQVVRQLVRPHRTTPVLERREGPGRAGLEPRGHDQRTRGKRGDGPRTRREVVVGIPHRGHLERPHRVGHHEVVERLRPRDATIAGLDARGRLPWIGAKPRRPGDHGLRPQRHVAHPRQRGRHGDRLAHPAIGRIEPEVEAEPARDGGRIARRRWCARQRQHLHGHGIAPQGIPVLAAEEREAGGYRVFHGGGRNEDAARREGKHGLVRDEQVEPAPPHEAGGRDLARRGTGIRPDAFRRLQRENRRAPQALAQVAGEPRHGDHIELLAHQHGVAREQHAERHALTLLDGRRRRGRLDQAPGDGGHGGGEPHPRAVHRDRERGGRNAPANLLHAHRSDHERARALRPQLELARGRAHWPAQRLERHLRDLARPDDGESRERGKGEGYRGGGSGARANREQQVVTCRDMCPVHARRHVGCRPALQRGEHPERQHHQSFTPGSAARRVWPVRSRRVLSSCWPIERNT